MPALKRSRSVKTRSMTKRTKTSRSGGKLSFDEHRYKLKYHSTITSSGAGAILFNISTSDPEAALIGSGTYEDWTSLEGLYDSYKVTGIRIQYTPYSPNSTSVANRPVFISSDHDDHSAPTSIEQVMVYTDVKIRDMLNPFDVYFPVVRKSSDKNPSGWLNVGNAGASANQISCIKMACEGLSASTQYGSLNMTLYVTMKGRR